MVESFRAGDSWDMGARLYVGYSPANGWSLKLILNSPSSRVELAAESISAAADGFGISVPMDKTAGIPAGEYDVVAVLSDGTKRTTIPAGRIVVLPDLAAATGPVDTRSFVKKTLDAIRAAIAGDTSIAVQSYEIHGRKIEYTDRAALLKYRAQFEQEYRNEQIARGEIQRSNYIPVGM